MRPVSCSPGPKLTPLIDEGLRSDLVRLDWSTPSAAHLATLDHESDSEGCFLPLPSRYPEQEVACLSWDSSQRKKVLTMAKK